MKCRNCGCDLWRLTAASIVNGQVITIYAECGSCGQETELLARVRMDDRRNGEDR